MGILIAIMLYIIVGLILFYGQDKWAKDNDPEFYNNMELSDWLKYFMGSVFLWLPYLLEYWFILHDNNKEK